MSLYLFSAALPLYLFRFRGYSLGQVGVLVGLASVVQIISALAAGPLVDRRGARLAMRLGAACYVVAALLFLTSAWLPAIVLARVLHGIGIALVLPAVFSVVPALVIGRFQGTALGAAGAVNNVALAVSPPLGLLLLARSPAALFLTALAAGGLAIAASLLLTVGRPHPEPGRLFNYRPAWTPFYAITFLCVVYWGVITAFLPIEVPPDQVPNVGWFFAADALAVMAARIPTGYMADRFGARWLLVAGVATTGVAIGTLLISPSLATLLIAGVGTGLGAALLLPPVLLALTRRSDERDRGTAMALYNTSFAAAVGAGSLGGAVLVQRFGFQVTLVASLIACLAAAPIALATVRRLEDR